MLSTFIVVKYQCFVLCLTVYIANSPPKAPPKNEKVKRAFSEIRHALNFAFILSTVYKIKVIADNDKI